MFRLPVMDISNRTCVRTPFINAPAVGGFDPSKPRQNRSLAQSNLPTACEDDRTRQIIDVIGPG